jgi:deoxyinosine 3'endonuclease (endonuclease V)
VQPPFVDFTLRHAQQLVAPTRADPLLIDGHAQLGNQHSRRTGAAHVM